MSKFFLPLKIFVGGQFLMLIVLLFFTAVGDASDTLAANTTAMASTFWGWAWIVGGTRLWIWLSLELCILFATAKAFLEVR